MAKSTKKTADSPEKKPKKSKSEPAKKQSTSNMSTLASKAIRGKKLTKTEVASLGGSVLSQDEKRGQN